MHVRPFRLLGASACSRLEAQLAPVLQAWRTDWMPASSAGITATLRVQPLDLVHAAPRATVEAAVLHSAPDAGACLLLKATSQRRALAVEWIPGTDRARQLSTPSPMSEALAERALDALQVRLLGARVGLGAQALPMAELDALLAAWGRAGSGAASVVITLGACVLSFVVDGQRAAVAAGETQPKAAQGGLAPRQAGVSNARLRLRAQLGHASLAIESLCTLQPGDVLRIDQRLDAPLVLATERGEPVCRGHLFSVQGRRAIVVER